MSTRSFARDVVLSDRLEEAIAALNMGAAMNALVLDREARRTFLSCHMVVHREILGWAVPLFMGAAAMQAAEAHAKAGPLSSLLGCEPDESAHPVSGPREEPDEMLSVMETLFAPAGQGPSRFPSALFTASPEEAYPRYGIGCLMLLRLPLSSLDGPAVNDLNRAEAEGAPSYGFGAWCVQDGTPVYALFLPNALYRPGLMKAMTMGAFGRCMWARDFLARHGRGAEA